MFKLKNQSRSTGQALVEFALIAVVLLMIIFLIVEAARILWAWGTVQNAAREGARYAITGQAERGTCPVDSLPKFSDTHCDDARVASIISRTHNSLAGLPLNETSGIFEDDEYYQIEVWGVDHVNQMQPNFGGVPNAPVIVRAYYRVPIITPFFKPLLSSIPVFGQAIMYNESFGQLGSGSNQGAALPPPMDAIPTVGVTPSPTNTPTPDPSTNTPIPVTNTYTPTPDFCRVKFDSPPVAGNNVVYISGEVGTLVRIVNLTTGGNQISTNYTMAGPFDGHLCPGFVTIILDNPLIEGHSLAVESSDGSIDIAFVLPGTPTPTPTNTGTATATPIPTATATPMTPSPTPPIDEEFIVVVPSCGSPVNGQMQITIYGYNWPDNRAVPLYWDNNLLVTVPRGHGGIFDRTLTVSASLPADPNTPDLHEVSAVISNASSTVDFQIPCDNATPVPTSTPTQTPTPNPADLVAVGAPQLASSGDVIAYQPVQYSVMISNTGDVDINNQFFVDLYLDPDGPIQPGDIIIPIDQSSGYAGISSLAGNTSKVITITAPFGFANEPDPHAIYGMVDSIEQIDESIEINNISDMASADYVTPGPTPTPTPTPPGGIGTNTIAGLVSWTSSDGLDPLHRALVKLYNSGGILINFTQADATGFYQFTNLPADNYIVTACGNLDGDRFGIRTGIVIPDPLPIVNIYTNVAPCP